MEDFREKIHRGGCEELSASSWYAERNAELKAHQWAWAAQQNLEHLSQELKKVLEREGIRMDKKLT